MTTLYAKLATVLLLLFSLVGAVLVTAIAIHQMLKGEQVVTLAIWVTVGGLVFAFSAGLLMFYSLTRRLHRLADAMASFEQSQFHEAPRLNLPLNDKTGDEIDRLAVSFQRVSTRIMQQLQQLASIDEQRRELLANVSHDLRTPLASLKGYLETILLKDDSLTRVEQRNYLETAARQCERLHRLVNDLFELTKFDAKEIVPRAESFSPAELAQDVVQKLRLKAEERGVRLEVDRSENIPQVRADIGLIERVLDNLIENALRHTSRGGVIRIVLAANDRKVTLAVCDTGSGIAQEDLAKIFDRFYQADRNQSHKSGGAGLGLAIAKRIIDLHGSDIQVRSQLEAGTTFSFDLQRA